MLIVRAAMLIRLALAPFAISAAVVALFAANDLARRRADRRRERALSARLACLRADLPPFDFGMLVRLPAADCLRLLPVREPVRTLSKW